MMKSMVRVGTVSDRNPNSCSVRVVFSDQDDLVSDWLPVVLPQALNTRDFSLPDIDETVVCVFLGSGIEAGFCLGAIYTDANPVGNEEQRGVWFPDGSYVVFDRETGTLTVAANGGVIITAPSTRINGDVRITGNLIVEGSITRGGVTL